eukprot:TRINITY_DN50175_c0_g1_i1.p2 TRINITY_DN50175_c0_g1~~TRINITY_DN50175_c0_g1_i1.p2  ORF type:complete len:154 (+),score=76.37 TRINITY_DN50175_c0_g1_i1:79-540(+)
MGTDGGADAAEGRGGGLARLEEFFQLDRVQERLSRFMHDEAQVNVVFHGLDPAAEQRHDYHAVWRRYEGLLEGLLEEFLQSSEGAGVERAVLLAELASMPDSWDELVCAPYIDAALRYEHFLALVRQWAESYDMDDAELREEEASVASADKSA